jgi:hypothetical protein
LDYTFPDDDTLYSWSKEVGLTIGVMNALVRALGG